MCTVWHDGGCLGDGGGSRERVDKYMYTDPCMGRIKGPVVCYR